MHLPRHLTAGLPWLPFALGAAAWVALGLAGQVRLGLLQLLLAGGLGVLWLLGRRLWAPALVVGALLAPLAWQQAVQLPAAERMLRQAAAAGNPVRLRGTVRRQQRIDPARGGGLRYHLGEVTVWGPSGGTRRVAELEVSLPGRMRRWRAWRREIRIAGVPVSLERAHGRLALHLARAGYHFTAPALPARGAEWVRAALSDRAGYYLSRPALAVYLPIVLGVREADSPEAREVVRAFRRVGIAHLFAISGLHVGLLFWILMGLQHLLGAGLVRRQGRVWARPAARLVIVALIWAYIALIGFPLPAVRAAVMGTALVWSQLWGTRSPRLYVLVLAGLLLLAITPTHLYDLSFQLSFLAYFCVVCALDWWERRPRPGERPGWGSRLGSAMGLNLLSTLLITVGLWPLIADTFGRVSLLVFAGNLLMIPLLSALVLPGGLLGLAVSAAHLGAPPGGWAERIVFGGLDALLGGWAALVQIIDRVGGALVFQPELDWGPRVYFAYYLAAGALLLAGPRLASHAAGLLRALRPGRDPGMAGARASSADGG